MDIVNMGSGLCEHEQGKARKRGQIYFVPFFYGQAASNSFSTFGFLMAMVMRDFAAPDGVHRPCSHSWRVRRDSRNLLNQCNLPIEQ